MESQLLGLIEDSFNSQYSIWVRETLDELCESFTITDPCISGHPIVFASPSFLKMSGYSRDEVIGQNGRIFQGPETNRRSLMEIREAIREERTIQINLLNYRKDGTPFWMLFHMSPVFVEENGMVIHFVAVQVPITTRQRNNRVSEQVAEFREIEFGSCRREVCSDVTSDLGRVLALDSDSGGLAFEEPLEASHYEKQRAATAMNNILSVLTHYSKSTGRMVCEKRHSLPAAGLLSSSVNISLGRIKQSFVLMDLNLPDMPIVYASDAFLKLTGYARHEVLGHNHRFLHGIDTDSSVLLQIEDSIQSRQPCTLFLPLDIRKDKSSFWTLLHVSPVRNATGKVAYFVGVLMEESCLSQDRHGLSHETRQLSVVGAVKVAIRTLSLGGGSSKS